MILFSAQFIRSSSLRQYRDNSSVSHSFLQDPNYRYHQNLHENFGRNMKICATFAGRFIFSFMLLQSLN